ncbi:MAG: ankyrin repeat domain-containing protein [Bacteroidota bacterium]
MYCLKRYFPVLSLLCFFFGFSQENKFLDRGYWQANPSIEQVEKDIAEGNDPSELNQYAFDAVSYAFLAKADNKTIKHLLTKEGNDVNKLTHDSRTYIFWAAYKDNLEMMQFLVDKGAKTDVVDSHGYSLLNFSAVTGQTNPILYDFILKHGADVMSETNLAGANALLLVSSFAKDFEIIDYFVSKGLSLKNTDNQGYGILEYAAKGGNIQTLKKLMSEGASFVSENDTRGNAIVTASQGTRGHENTLETYKFLESQGLNPAAVDASGKNALHNIAYDVEDLAILDYFLLKGTDVNQQDEDGRTPLMNASQYNSLEVVKLLSSKVADINVVDEEGKTALTMAVIRNHPEVVAYLLDKGAKANLKDKKGNNLAYYLVQSYNPKKPDSFEKKLELLEAKGVSLASIQHDGNTLLHLAAKKNNLALLERLKGLEIPINLKNTDGNTALHLAAMSADNDAILKYLIEQGADKTVLTDFDESVFDLANENELLQENGITLEFLK